MTDSRCSNPPSLKLVSNLSSQRQIWVYMIKPETISVWLWRFYNVLLCSSYQAEKVGGWSRRPQLSPRLSSRVLWRSFLPFRNPSGRRNPPVTNQRRGPQARLANGAREVGINTKVVTCQSWATPSFGGQDLIPGPVTSFFSSKQVKQATWCFWKYSEDFLI